MVEILIFVCILAILVPSFFLSALIYNTNRTLQGKKPLSIEEAVVASFKSAVKKAQEMIRSLLPSDSEKEEKKDVEDAEYREVTK